MKLAPALGFKHFRRLYLAGSASELGSFITETALMLFLFDLTLKDKTYLGLSRAVFIASLTAGSLVASSVSNVLGKKKTMIFCEFIRLPGIISILFFKNPMWVIFVNGLIAFFTGIFNPTRQTSVNQLVPKEQIKSANSLFGSTLAIFHLACPFIGAWIYTTTKGIKEVVAIDASTYIIGILFLWMLPKLETKEDSDAEKESSFQEIKNGFLFVLKRNDLKVLFKNYLAQGLCIGVLIPLLLPHITENLGRAEKDYGIILAAFGFGGLVGGLISEKLGNFFKPHRLIILGVLTEVIMMTVWIHIHTYWLVLFLLFVWGVSVFARITNQLNYISDTVETRYLSHVHSIAQIAFILPNFTGGMAVALLGKVYSTQQILLTTSIIFLILIVPRFIFGAMAPLWNSDRDSISREIIN